MSEINSEISSLVKATAHILPNATADSLTATKAQIETDASISAKSEKPSESFDKNVLQDAGTELSEIVKSVSGGETDLSFSVEGDLSRMVVTVRAVGSDEVIRQFPPEEFLTVAKFIAAQDVSQLDEDFLKGILFDRRI